MNIQTTSTNPEIQALLNQSQDLRDYLNSLEMLSDLWNERDEELFLFLDLSLNELEEEIHYLRITEFF